MKTINLATLFPNFNETFLLFSTIPDTVASAEHSFSVLKVIENVDHMSK